MARCTPRVSIDDAFDLLSSARRRHLLHYLLEAAEPPVYRDELADRVAAESDVDPVSIETALAHLHLPKLADAGVIEYDHRSGAVRPTAAARELKPLLDTVWEEWEATEE